MTRAQTHNLKPASRKARLSSARSACKVASKHKVLKTTYTICGEKFIATDVFDTFWRFAAERQSIYNKRKNGVIAPWTEDPILQKHRFCNIFRLTDTTCQYIIKWVIGTGSQTPAELVFRVLLFDTFTRVDTWEYILREIGAPTWATYKRETYEKVFRRAKDNGIPLYTGSFQKPAPQLGYPDNFMNHLKALELFMEADLPGWFVSATRMADVFDWLRTFKGMGDFTAYQLLLNLTYTGLVNFSDADTFVVVGPGARAGLKRCFGPNLSHSQELDIIRWMQLTQKEHFARLGVSCSLGPPRSAHHEMQLCDMEHTLCEIDKYVRLQSRIGHSKRVFEPSGGPTPEYSLPPVFSDDNEERWVVTRIGGKKTKAGILYYQVFWEGYVEPTWEPADMIKEDAPLAVKEFLDCHSSHSGKRLGSGQACAKCRHDKTMRQACTDPILV